MNPSAGSKPVLVLTGASGLFGRTFLGLYSGKFEIIGIYNKNEFPTASSHTAYFDPIQRIHSQYSIRSIHCDLADLEMVKKTANSICDLVGSPNVLINAAADTRFLGSMLDASGFIEAWQNQHLVNAIAPCVLASSFFERCWRSIKPTKQNACIINVSSISGMQVFPGSRQATYAASKAALNMLTAYMTQEYAAYGIQVKPLVPASFQSGETAGQVCIAAYRLITGISPPKRSAETVE